MLKWICRRLARFSIKHDLTHAWPMAFFMTGYMVWFSLIEMIPRKYYLQVILLPDRYIPFVEQFVIPYYSWFFFVGFGLVLVYFRDRNEYDRMCTTLMLGMGLFLIVSTFLPTRQPLRIASFPRHNIFTKLIGKLWLTDTPTNVWPSIHVYNTAAIETAFFHADHPALKKKPFRIATMIWSVLIILSTMFIKQHSLFDVLSALSFIAIAYGIVYMSGKVVRWKKWGVWAKDFERRYG